MTTGSYDLYRFEGTAGDTVLFDFSYGDPEGGRYYGFYHLEFYQEGVEEPVARLPSNGSYNTAGTGPEVPFTPTEDGPYLLRVVGDGTPGSSIVRYSFAFVSPQ